MATPKRAQKTTGRTTAKPRSRTRGLGRGLEALLGPDADVTDSSAQTVGTGLQNLPLTALVAGKYQPRRHMDEGALYELAESIKAQGVMQPLLVRPLEQPQGDATHEIIAGERRFRAADLAGLREVPVIVKPVSDHAAAAMALIENMQREDLNPLEEAQGLYRLINEFDLTHEQAAQAVGRSRSAASNLLRLLNLAEPVQTMLMAGDIDMGHARALLAVDSAQQILLANTICGKKLSVRQTERLVKQAQQPASGGTAAGRGKAAKSRDIVRVEEELADLLATDVTITLKKKSKRGQTGELSIVFHSLDQLNAVIERLQKNG